LGGIYNLACDAEWNHDHTLFVHLARGEHGPGFSLGFIFLHFSILPNVMSGKLSWGHLILSNFIDLTALTQSNGY